MSMNHNFVVTRSMAATRVMSRMNRLGRRAPTLQLQQATRMDQGMDQGKRDQQNDQGAEVAPVAKVSDTEDAISITFRGRTVRARRGARLRTVLLRTGLTPHNGDSRLINCRGLGTCGTCAVQISGPVEPASWTRIEVLRLNVFPHSHPQNQQLRLACQVRCMGDVAVMKRDGFWGQGSVLLGDLAGDESSVDTGILGVGTTPLGELEYLLDKDGRC